MAAPTRLQSTTHPEDRLDAIVTTLLPDYPALDAAGRDTVEKDVRAYVGAQMRAMPRFLRLPFRAALAAFELLAMARHGSRFANLSIERRVAYVGSWSGAPVAAMRDFLRLVRGTTLLVYFDHPLVRGRLDAELGAGGNREEAGSE